MIPRYLKQPFVVTGACMSAYIVIFVFLTGLMSPRFATLAAIVGGGALCAESLYRGIIAQLLEKLGPMVPWILFAMLGYAVLPLIPYAGSRAWNNLTGVVYGISIFLVVRHYGRIAFIEPLYMSYVFIVLCLFILFPSVLGVSGGGAGTLTLECGSFGRGERPVAPKIGDGVYIGPGAKIYGNIVIADGIAIGANAVVNTSFTEPNITIAGVPAKKISSSGALVAGWDPKV